MVPKQEAQNSVHRWRCGLRDSASPVCNDSAISDHQKAPTSAPIYVCQKTTFKFSKMSDEESSAV